MKITKRIINDYRSADLYLGDKVLPISYGAKIAKNASKLEPALDALSVELRELEEKYGIYVNTADIFDPDNTEFMYEYMNLMNEEVEIDIELIPISVFEETGYTIKELKTIIFMIDTEA